MFDDHQQALLQGTFGPVNIVGSTDVNEGRGIFSDVTRIELTATTPDIPRFVIVKEPTAGANGQIAIDSGACRREFEAYRMLTPVSPVRSPVCYGADGKGRFLLEDLTPARWVEQAGGAGVADAAAVVAALGRFHRYWQTRYNSLAPPLRINALAQVPRERFDQGWQALQDAYLDHLPAEARGAYKGLATHIDVCLVAYDTIRPLTVTHGDPRIDNICFLDDVPVFFDWQQVAVQPGTADLAWFLATSLTTDTRRVAWHQLTECYAAASGRPEDEVRAELAVTWLLPGLMSLLLATRVPESAPAKAFILESLRRIGTVLSDEQVVERVLSTT